MPLSATLAIVLMASSCGNGTKLTGIQVYPVNPNTVIGSPVQFSVTSFYSNNTQQTVPALQTTWSSSNVSIATIDSNGVATGVATGSTTITAAANGRTSVTVLSVNQ
jgi:Big-like domain-containing protein